MTQDEELVLNYVDFGLGGPDSIDERLRPTFHKLIQDGMIEEVSYFVLTSSGQEAISATYQKS